LKAKHQMPEADGQCPECNANDWALKRRKYGDERIVMAEFECLNCGCTVVLNFGDDDEFASELEDLSEAISEPYPPTDGGGKAKRGIAEKKRKNQKPPRTVTFAIESLMKLVSRP
jgi:hypothetical protein